MMTGTDYAESAQVRWPVMGCPISQRFGENASFYIAYGLAGHEGVDMACPAGTPVRAMAAGVVWRAGVTTGAYGTRVILRHRWGYSLYAHLSEVGVAVGTTVSAGTVIGRSGNTGRSTGAHLHWAVALPVVNPGYACPTAMRDAGTRQRFWWHDPLAETTRQACAAGGG